MRTKNENLDKKEKEKKKENKNEATESVCVTNSIRNGKVQSERAGQYQRFVNMIHLFITDPMDPIG